MPSSKRSPQTSPPCGTRPAPRPGTASGCLRTLIADVTLLAEPDFAKARIGIRWHTGATDELVVARRQAVTEYRRTDPAAIDLARSLSHLSNNDIARAPNAAGYTTGAGRAFDNDAVASLRHYHHSPGPTARGRRGHRRRYRPSLGIATAPSSTGSHGAGCLHGAASTTSGASHSALTSKPSAGNASPVSAHPRPDSTDPKAAHELTVGEVAAVLGISTNVVYYWIERHHIDARRAPGGRLCQLQL